MKNHIIVDSLQSKVIYFLRFILILGIILIHTQVGTINDVPGNLSMPRPFNGAFPCYEMVLYYVVKILSRIAVPLFFMFSGFLFFYKLQDLTFNEYKEKLRKRCKTLLFPYLFWNILYVVFYVLLAKLFHQPTLNIGEGYAIKDWILSLWNYNGTKCPVSYQFWFIRDLMVVMLASPIIYWLIQKTRYVFVLCLSLIWLMECCPNVVVKIDAFLFFSLGAYFSILKKDFTQLVKHKTALLGILYFLVTMIIMYLRDYEFVIYIKKIGILLGMAFVIALSSVFIETKQWKINSFFVESSFFLYAYHIMAIPFIRSILLYIIPCKTDAGAIIFHFLWAIATIVIGQCIYFVLRKWMPKTTALINGGR